MHLSLRFGARLFLSHGCTRHRTLVGSEAVICGSCLYLSAAWPNSSMMLILVAALNCRSSEETLASDGLRPAIPGC